MKEFMEKKAKQVFGETYVVNSMERILGGAQKHTYLARCTNGFSFVIYVWGKDTSYFNNETAEDPFTSNSAKLFLKNNRLMETHGVLVPKLYFMDDSKKEKEFAYAFVQYIGTTDLDKILANAPERLAKVLLSLKTSIDHLHQIKSEFAGQFQNLQSKEFNPITYCLSRGKKDCSYLRKVDAERTQLYTAVEEQLEVLSRKAEPRQSYVLIHNELGPNHVMVDEKDNAYLIDIEGAKFFDQEAEDSFLRLRFGDNYQILEGEGLDPVRMEFYTLCHCAGNLAGAMELKQKDYYDMEDLEQMITYFIDVLEGIRINGSLFKVN